MALDPREAIRSELMGEKYGTTEKNSVHGALMHAGGPQNLQHVAYTLQDKVTHAAKEITLWLPGRTAESPEIKAFLANPSRKDTNLGHSINAASLARIAVLILKRIAERDGIDIHDLLP